MPQAVSPCPPSACDASARGDRFCGRRAFERDDREWQSIGGVPVRGRRTLTLLFFIHASRVLRSYDHDNTKTAIDFLQQVREHFPFAIQKIQTDNGSSFGPQVTWYFSDLHISHKHIPRRCREVNGTVERSHKTDSEGLHHSPRCHDLRTRLSLIYVRIAVRMVANSVALRRVNPRPS
jgi:hypothetical protein